MMSDGYPNDSLRAILHGMVEVDDEAEGLERVEQKYRDVAIRMRRLIGALGLNKTSFAEATNGAFGFGESPLRRIEVTDATNGKQLATTERWHRGVAHAAGVDVEMAAGYLRGRVTLEDLIARRAVRAMLGAEAPPLNVGQGTTGGDDLSPNAGAAMAAFDWTDVDRATYDRVHDALAASHQAGGRDPFPSFWTAEIKRHIREASGKPEKAVAGVTPAAAEARDDDDLASHKAAKKKKK